MNVFTANIQREWLARIIDRSKPIEYRDATEYWINRLFKAGPPPFHLRLINGMKPDSPEATALIDKVDMDLLAGAIRLHIADILSVVRWNPAWHVEYPPLPPPPPVDFASLASGTYKPPKLKLKVAAALYDDLQQPGPHFFSVPITGAYLKRLTKYDDVFLLNISSGDHEFPVIAYSLKYEPFEMRLDAHVLTPNAQRA